jgi:NAD-dependent SIR2 family protein deacetylase
MRCMECEGPVKPEIVFFGEDLPLSFFKGYKKVENNCDLLIVIGTALAVSPFNHLVNTVGDCPKVLFNMNNTKDSGYNFND